MSARSSIAARSFTMPNVWHRTTRSVLLERRESRHRLIRPGDATIRKCTGRLRRPPASRRCRRRRARSSRRASVEGDRLARPSPSAQEGWDGPPRHGLPAAARFRKGAPRRRRRAAAQGRARQSGRSGTRARVCGWARRSAGAASGAASSRATRRRRGGAQRRRRERRRGAGAPVVGRGDGDGAAAATAWSTCRWRRSASRWTAATAGGRMKPITVSASVIANADVKMQEVTTERRMLGA